MLKVHKTPDTFFQLFNGVFCLMFVRLDAEGCCTNTDLEEFGVHIGM